jgi:hypothetical protein
MKFRNLANGMVFQFKFDQQLRNRWWYTKIDDLYVICVGSYGGANEDIGDRSSINETLLEEEVVLAKSFSS